MKKIAYLKKENKKTFSRRNLLSSATKKLVTTLMVLLFLAQMIAPFIISAENKTINNNGPVKASPQGETKNVSNWKQLMDLGNENGGVVTINKNYIIKIKDNLVATCPIIITGNVHISADTSKTIYRQKGNANFTVFTVDNGGTLTLGNNVTMSGQIAETHSKAFKITVTDAYGAVLYEETVYEDETRTPKTILQEANIYTKEDALNLIKSRTENDSDSPYSLGYKLQETPWDMAGFDDTPMKDVDGNLLIVAKWDNPDPNKVLHVEDGYGNEIYRVEVPAKSSKTARQLMREAVINGTTYNIENDNSHINTVLGMKLASVSDGPYALGFKFKEWDFGGLGTQPFSSHSGDFYVIANWNNPDYVITLTDGYGRTVKTIAIPSNTHKKPIEILTEEGLSDESDTGKANIYALMGQETGSDTGSPYYLGYALQATNPWNMAGKRNNYMDTEIEGHLLISAIWKKPYVFKVTDDNGNVLEDRTIYRDSADANKTIIELMQNTQYGDLINDTTNAFNTAKTAWGSSAKTPWGANGWDFTGWDYGNVDPNQTLNTIDGNVTVCAAWTKTGGTTHTWEVPTPENGTEIEIGLGNNFVSFNSSNVTSWSPTLTDNTKFVMTDVSDGSFRLKWKGSAENNPKYFLVLTNGVNNKHNTLIGSYNDAQTETRYSSFFKFVTNGDKTYLTTTNPYFTPDWNTNKTRYINIDDYAAIWFTIDVPGDSANPYVGQAVDDFENADTPGKTDVPNPTGTPDTPGVTPITAPTGTSDTPGRHNNSSGSVPQTTKPKQSAAQYQASNVIASESPVKNVLDARYTRGGADNTQIFVKDGYGFFVHVNSGGTLDIEGAILTKLITGRLKKDANNLLNIHDDSTVKNAAPVVVDGGTLHFTSGAIMKNEVGYLPNENKSGMMAQGNNPEDGSGVENFIKTTTMMNTAGGIIFKNGAIGSISRDASIEQNKGDTGGIMVQGKGTDVTLGGYITGTINANAEDPYANVGLQIDNGGHIDQNVGFHHAGAALVENGGTLRMVGVDSTMNHNVTWAKGGAVWATDFGTNGYAKIDYKQKYLTNPDKKQPNGGGIFIMKNGTLDNNTAFLRGGAINVQSDRVHLLGGTISNNNSRVLGGGIYVEGDFADYTYTLMIDKGYIGHNYAVRFWDLDSFNDDENNIGGLYDNYSLRQLNNRLDRKLGRPIPTRGPVANPNGNPLVDEEWNPANNTYFAGMPDGYANKRTADIKAYYKPHEGFGGGVWLCPIGGTAIFHLHNEHEVIIDDNYASGAVRNDSNSGTDIYLHSGTGHILVSNSEFGGEDWINEKTGDSIKGDGETYSGPLYLENQTTDDYRQGYSSQKADYSGDDYNQKEALNDNENGIRIINNVSRDGGGIGANGTLLFGAPEDVYKHDAKLNFKKIWPANSMTYPVTFKMFYIYDIVLTEQGGSAKLTVKSNQLDADENGKIDSTYTKDGKTYEVPNIYVNKDAEPILDGYEFNLDGKADNDDTYNHSPETTSANNGLQDNHEYHWTANTTIPISIESFDVNGDPISLPLYKLEYTGQKTSVEIEVGGTTTGTDTIQIPVVNGKKILDPSNEEDIKVIYALAKDKNEQKNFKVAEWNIVIKEYNAAGMEINEAEFSNITSEQVVFTKDDDVNVIDAGGVGKKIKGYSIGFSEASFLSTAKNGEGPTVEKYINNKVHQGLVSFDEQFEYSIMAYVPLDAKEVVIEDTLVNALMFVSADNKPQFTKFGSKNSYPVYSNIEPGGTWNGDYWIYVEEDEPENNLEAGALYRLTKPVIVDNGIVHCAGISTIAERGIIIRNTNFGDYVNGFSTTYNQSPVVNNSSTTGYDLIILSENNHKGNGLPLDNENHGTVTNHTDITTISNDQSMHLNGPINGDTIKIGYYNNDEFVEDRSGNTIRVTVTEDMLTGEHSGSTSTQVDAHGKWIVLSFDAMIKPQFRDVDLLKQGGWISTDESKIGRENFLSELEEKAGVTIDRVYKVKNDKGLYYARGIDSNGEKQYFVYISVSPDKMRNMDDNSQPSNHNSGVEKEKFVAHEWYKVYKETNSHSKNRSVSYPEYQDVNLYHAYYKVDTNDQGEFVRGYEFEGDVLYNNVKGILDRSESAIDFEDVYNYPVIDAQKPHSGVKNQANYTVTFPNDSKSTHKTNIVTVDVVQPEKYVNNKVHDVLRHDTATKGSFDEPFEYEIMVYVPEDAEEIIIYDTLRDDLMFVDRHWKTQYKTYTIGTTDNPGPLFEDIDNPEFMQKRDGDTTDGQSLVSNTTKQMLEYYDNNNHIGDGNGTVASQGTPLNLPITFDNNHIRINAAPEDPNNVNMPSENNPQGNTIYLKIDSDTGIETVKGKWVKLSFNAQLRPSQYRAIVNKIQKDNRLTENNEYAMDYDPETNTNPTPVGYKYRTSKYTTLPMNAVGYDPEDGKVNSTSRTGYYTKDSNGRFTIRHGKEESTYVAPTGTAGEDYIWEYECNFIFHVDKLDDVPASIRNDNTMVRPQYLRKGWNDTDPSISWEMITDDGNVLDGKKLHREDDVYKYIGVQADGSHAGLANNANYAVKINNQWRYITTNTVTVVPLLRTLTFNKVWIIDPETNTVPSALELLDNLKLYWEKVDTLPTTSEQHRREVGDITDIYKDKFSIVEEKVETISGSERHTWRIEIKDLPQLRPHMKYFVEEIKLDGFDSAEYLNPEDPEATIHAHDKGTIINSEEEKPGETHLTVRKTWDVGNKNEEKEAVQVQLYADGKPIYLWLDEPDTDTDKNLDNSDKTYYITKDTDGYFTVINETRPSSGTEGVDYLIKYRKVDPMSIKTLSEEENGWFYQWRPLNLYKTDINGDVIVVSTQDIESKIVINYSVELLSDPEGYILSSIEKVDNNYTETTTLNRQEAIDYDPNTDRAKVYKVYRYELNDSTLDYDLVEVIDESDSTKYEYFYGEAGINNTENDNSYRDICISLPSAPITTACEYRALEEYPTYEVQFVNTKPQIEKYINKDVHLETYYSNNFRYDIIVYVPEEATSIEIYDELLPTLKFDDILVPQISGPENRKIEGYNKIGISQINPNEFMEFAVHAENNHTINGTVASNTVAGIAYGKLKIKDKKLTVNIGNIVYTGKDYTEYQYGEYVRVVKIDGSDEHYTKDPKEGYIVVDQNYYRKVEEEYFEIVDDASTLSDNEKYVRLVGKGSNSRFVKYCLESEKTNYEQSYEPESNSISTYYRKVTSEEIAQQHIDQRIGGRYIQVSFDARFDLTDQTQQEMQDWVNNSSSKNNAKKELYWDVITETANIGWDNYIENTLGISRDIEYVPVPNVNITKLVKNGNKYYAATDGTNYYVYPMNLTTDSQYNNQWFRVEAGGPKYYDMSGNLVKSSRFDDNDDYWFQDTSGQKIFIKETVDKGNNILDYLVLKDTYNKESGTPDKYYLDWVVDNYAGDKKDSIKANGIYKKVDWGRGDGDINRINPTNPSIYTGNHAGVVNTASYDVTYGNGYKSTHKSNTVTVVPEIYRLPSSGGIGTFLFNILGVMFMTLALTEFVLKKRKGKFN